MTLSPMLRPYLFILLCALYLLPGAASAQKLVEWEHMEHYTLLEMSAMGLNPQNEVDAYRIRYETPSWDGSVDTATGALLVPDLSACSEGFSLVSYQHGTVLEDENVPSEDGSRLQGLHFAGDAYLVTMPDYLGLGGNEGLHPYHHAESEATASLDMIRAGREYIEDESAFDLNGELFLTGYSQGGHSTMALHRYIETNGLLDSFDVKLSAPLSGAYDLSGEQSRLPSDSLYSNPAYFAYIIEAYEMVYGNIYNSPADVYEAPYHNAIPVYTAGDSSLESLNDTLPSNIYAFIEDSVLDPFYADTIVSSFSHPLRSALYDNDLYRWGPERKLRIYYCGGDQQVFPENSEVARDSMPAYGANDIEAEELYASAGHSGCFIPAMQAAKEDFDAERTGCTASSLAEWEKEENELQVLEIGGARKEVITPYASPRYELYSSDGQLLDRGSENAARFVLNTSSLPRGVYLLRVRGNSRGKEALRRRILVR